MAVLFARIWILRVAFWIFWPLPVRRKVVLASNDVDHLRGNLAHIHEELVARGGDFRVVTLLHRPRPGVRGKLAMLAYAIRAEYHLATSRVFVVDDYFFPIYVIRPKSKTTIVQTWHACGAFKKVGYSLAGKQFGAGKALLDRVRIHANYDVCLVASPTSVPHYAEAFGQPAERFVSIGIPRADFFADEGRISRALDDVRREYDIPADRTIVLYAPTFRGASKRKVGSELHLDLRELERRLGDGYVVLLRRHPLVASRTPIDPDLRDFARDVSGHEDINELLAAADLLVTDYSSVIFEFALLERPMAFLAPDLATYEGERGFYFDYAEGVPGPVFSDTPRLAEWIAAEEHDLEKVRAFRRRSFEVVDGRASTRFVDQIVLPALG